MNRISFNIEMCKSQTSTCIWTMKYITKGKKITYGLGTGILVTFRRVEPGSMRCCLVLILDFKQLFVSWLNPQYYLMYVQPRRVWSDAVWCRSHKGIICKGFYGGKQARGAGTEGAGTKGAEEQLHAASCFLTPSSQPEREPDLCLSPLKRSSPQLEAGTPKLLSEWIPTTPVSKALCLYLALVWVSSASSP